LINGEEMSTEFAENRYRQGAFVLKKAALCAKLSENQTNTIDIYR
jgi:hypothetical protein